MVSQFNQVTWRKSSRSGGENCVEIAAARGAARSATPGMLPHRPMLAFSGPDWIRFLTACTKGEFDVDERVSSQQVGDWRPSPLR